MTRYTHLCSYKYYGFNLPIPATAAQPQTTFIHYTTQTVRVLEKKKMWFFFKRNGPSGFSHSSTAEEVTNGIDASGLTAIVTGASSGIGAETARVLALRGAHVIMGVRNMAAGNKVRETISREIPAAKIDAMELDLSSIASVKKFASEFDASGNPLNILINNAGVMAPPFKLSKDNIELQFATNHLGHFLLTNLLLDTMKKTSQKSKTVGRIVNVSSEAHRLPYREGIRFDKINDKEGYNNFAAYGQSKLANVLHSNELTRRLKEEGLNITANSLHPGIITTNLFRNLGFLEGLVNNLGKFVLKNVQQHLFALQQAYWDTTFTCTVQKSSMRIDFCKGAATTCYVALNPQVKELSGEYFVDSNVGKASSKATDVDLAKRLWDFSTKLVDSKLHESIGKNT